MFPTTMVDESEKTIVLPAQVVSLTPNFAMGFEEIGKLIVVSATQPISVYEVNLTA
jgi:hypothetical protein